MDNILSPGCCSGVGDFNDKSVGLASRECWIGVLTDEGVGVFAKLKTINIVKKIPKIVVAVVNVGSVAIKRSSCPVGKGSAVAVKIEALADLIICKTMALGSLVIVSQLPRSIFNLFGKAVIPRVATAGIGTGIAHGLIYGIGVLARSADKTLFFLQGCQNNPGGNRTG